MVTFNVSGQLFTLAEADILKYPYSKLADVSSYTLADDIASLNVPADSFAILVHYLSTSTFPSSTPLPSTLESTFKTLGIHYPSALCVDQHTASIGASGTLREWEARLPASLDSTSSERWESLRAIEAGLLTGRPRPSLTPANSGTTGELPAYSDISPTLGLVANKHDLVPAVVRNLSPNGMSYAILIPSDERSLAAVERPSWDTGTGAAEDEEVLSFATVPKEQKKVLRLPSGGGYTWDCISQATFQSNIQRDVQQALYHRYSVGEKGVVRGAFKPVVSLWAEEELVLKNISPMGLYETKSGRAVVVQVVWK